MKKPEIFNLVITGVGGQGIITLLQIISRACLISDFDVKTSELHGLSQRGGSVEVHARFALKKQEKEGNKNIVFSPLVRQGGADLILSLDSQEAQGACYYASQKQTIFAINDFLAPMIGEKPLPKNDIMEGIKGFTKEIFVVPASLLCQKELGKDVTAGVFLLSFASFRGLLPFSPAKILEVIEEEIPSKYLKLNKDAFNLAGEYSQNLTKRAV